MEKLTRAIDRSFAEDEPHWTVGDVMLILCASGIIVFLVLGIIYGHIN